MRVTRILLAWIMVVCMLGTSVAALADETQITTGDATSQGSTQNVVNNNEIHTDQGEGTNASSTPELTEEQNGTHASSTPPTDESAGHSTTDVDVANNANVNNGMEVQAQTGANMASSTGPVAIDTGDAMGAANVVNVVNTTFVDSEGMFLLLTHFFEMFGNLDLRNFMPGGAGQQDCPSPGCQTGTLNISANSSAAILNDVIVRSSTGYNNASSTDAGASITTGNAYGAANVVNVANANFVNSNYLVVMFNNFGDLFGDIVFPGQDFFSQFFGSSPTGQVNAQTSSSANIANNAETVADTGQNAATNTNGDSSITSGNAQSATNVINQTNGNFFGNHAIIISLRIFGDWVGDIFSLPEGIGWQQTPQGISLVSQTRNAEEGSGPAVNINASSTAAITNNVKVFALTGKNNIDAGGAAVIRTGNAYSATNIVNIANTNVVGKNWIHAIINVFGKWKGNLAFGRPNLWIGTKAQVDANPLNPGSGLTYQFTLANKGDADATDVKVSSSFNDTLFTLQQSSLTNRGVQDGALTWNIGTIKAGQTVTFNYDASVQENVPIGLTRLTITSRATSHETDQDVSDNTDNLSLNILRNVTGGGSSQGGPQNTLNANGVTTLGQLSNPLGTLTPAPDLSLTKFASVPIIQLPESRTVDYTLTVTNNSDGSLYQSVVVDTLRNEQGDDVHRETWDLGEIFPHEEIIISYTVAFNATSTPGMYINNAYVEGLSGSPDTLFGSAYRSREAVSFIELKAAKAISIEPTVTQALAVSESVASSTPPITPQTTTKKSHPLGGVISSLFANSSQPLQGANEFFVPVVAPKEPEPAASPEEESLPLSASLLTAWLRDPRFFLFFLFLFLTLIALMHRVRKAARSGPRFRNNPHIAGMAK